MFNKKVFAGLCLAVILTVTSVVPALAYDQTSQPTANVKAKIQQKLQTKATKAGVDITGLSNKDALAKIKAGNQAKKSGVQVN